MSGSATVWRPNVEGLSRHFRTYAVDVIGQAGKSVASRRTRNRHDAAGWFTDLLDALGIERTSIVGNSYGGFLALNQASLTPDRVDRVVLISPAGTFVRLPWTFFYKILLLVLTRNTRTPDIANLLGTDVTFAPGDAPWRAQISLAMSGARFSRPPNVVPPLVFNTTELRAIRAPTLLLIGDKETLYEPHAALKRALDRMPGLTGEIVPDAHHIAAMAQPEYVNDRIVRFLNRSDGMLP
jgi:pimeloyl-ACP methyl ester carboxylesterase